MLLGKFYYLLHIDVKLGFLITFLKEKYTHILLIVYTLQEVQ